MCNDFWGPRGFQETNMDTLKPKNSKLITFTVRGGFFTFWVILAHSVAYHIVGGHMYVQAVIKDLNPTFAPL